MMQLARRASLVGVLFLALVGTASAECAWVLWRNTDWHSSDKAGNSWEIGAAFPSLPACNTGLKNWVQQLAANYRSPGFKQEIRTSERVVTALTYEDKTVIFNVIDVLHCLPDTIDPRGAKGGGR